jgi:hypothetical protein
MDDAVPAVKTPTIGIVAEGASDQVVLQFILAGYFGDKDIDPNPLQPFAMQPESSSRVAGAWYWNTVHQRIFAGPL